MSERATRRTRRLRWAAPLTAVLILATGTVGAHAFWESRRSLDAGVVTTGDLSLRTEWVGSAPSAPPLRPGSSVDSPILRVTEAGAGTTLRWRLSASADNIDGVTTRIYRGPCADGILLPPSGYAPAGGLAPGETVLLCVRIAVNEDAPSSLTGAIISPTITLIADQVMS